MISMSGFPDASGSALVTRNRQKSASGVSSTTDPGADVRGNITRLTARARQLLANDTDTRVVRNGLSAYETSRKMAAEVSARTRTPGQGGSTQASVELFLASLGFNLQEQLRLLQQLQSTHVPLAAAGGVGAAAAETPGAIFPTHTDDELGSVLESFLANRRAEIMRRSVEEMHRHVREQVQERSGAIIRASWDKCSVEVADAFETFLLRAGGARSSRSSNNNNNTQLGHLRNSAGGSISNTMQPRAGVTALLSGRDAASTRALNQIVAFAQIVDTHPPLQWLTHFSAHVADNAPSITDEVSLLWTTVEQILQPIAQRGSASTTMTFVASSRHMMERKALVGVLSRTLKVEPERFGELENMHAMRFVGVVERHTSTSNLWAQIFTAMRCGRYDSAVIIANAAGFWLVETKLNEYAKAHMTQRSTVPPGVELRPLYEEEATRLDPYRQIVLLLLLLGNTGESSDVVLSTMASLSSKVARSLEDTLWIRLFCVRSVEIRNDDRVQALSEMQRLLLDDMQELVVLVRGNSIRLASLLIHALLPSSGLRLLTEDDSTYLDGIHLAICFHNYQLLSCNEVEVPLDLSRLLQQYCSLVLLDTDKRHPHISRAGGAVFRYFLCTNLVSAFIDYCNNELVCARLFGHRGGSSGTDGVLLQQGTTPSTELLEALERIAEAAVARGKKELAVHIFAVLERASALVQDESRASYALNRALQVICPALSQAFHQPPTNESANLFLHAADLQERVARSTCVIPHTHAEAFQLLCKMSEVFLAVARDEAEVAHCSFLSLPFIPTSAENVERCAELFDATSECIATAAPPIVLLAMKNMVKLAETHKLKGEGGAAAQLRRQAQLLTMWVRRWKRHVGRRLIEELSSIEQLFAL